MVLELMEKQIAKELNLTSIGQGLWKHRTLRTRFPVRVLGKRLSLRK